MHIFKYYTSPQMNDGLLCFNCELRKGRKKLCYKSERKRKEDKIEKIN